MGERWGDIWRWDSRSEQSAIVHVVDYQGDKFGGFPESRIFKCCDNCGMGRNLKANSMASKRCTIPHPADCMYPYAVPAYVVNP